VFAANQLCTKRTAPAWTVAIVDLDHATAHDDKHRLLQLVTATRCLTGPHGTDQPRRRLL